MLGTPEETSALIDTYRDKWYSLGRTNLKAIHWQEVADAITAQCPNASATAKTAVQCRHKMEKFRKRYRTEIQCLRSLPLPSLINNSTTASPSSWVHFKSMDSMEKGPNKPHTDTTAATNPNNLNFPDDDPVERFTAVGTQRGTGIGGGMMKESKPSTNF
ncbi:trihelix transcription factor ASIL2-like [Vigna umbellata]|uniref:trihelix transcription factor ASIL2-like n=1 Tax=Vigna umbellata TaxID=87088 RepID=UPI001F5EC4E2|nr:trihelix transcription factor ASIL2-like [Vigna umbellata]